jgi:general secretion pathway protein G
MKPARSRLLAKAAVAATLSLCCVLLTQAGNVSRTAPDRLRESTLRSHLSMMRIAIDNYTLDKEWPPQSLQNLVDAQYLPAIPTDPFTESKDWVCEVGEMDLGSELRPRGLYDVHSRSNKLAADGSRYDRW